MRIELTAHYRGISRDVAVDAPKSAAVSDVLPLLARTLGAPAAAPAWLDDRLLTPHSLIAGSGLRPGAVLTFADRPTPAGSSGVLSLRVVGGPSAGTVHPLSAGRLIIGRDAACDVPLADADVSRVHASLEVTASTITLHDLGSTNGTRLAGSRVPTDGVRVSPGGLIAMGDSTLLVSAPGDPPAAVQPGADGTSIVLRAPRRVASWAVDEIALPQRGGASRPRGVQWLAALIPAAAGGAMAWFAHAPQFLLFALLSPVMIISTALGDRLHWRRSRRREAATYRRRRAAVDEEIAQCLAAEAGARRHAAPDPAAVGEHAALPGCRLWERRRSDADLLAVRLGLTELPSSLVLRDGATTRPAGTVSAVPACVDLRRGPLGIAGPPRVVAALGRWVVGQLAVSHSPADVEIALLLDSARAPDWAWARWLPHVRGRVATSEQDRAAVVTDLCAIVEQRLSASAHDPSGRHGPLGWRGPWLLLVVDRVGELTELPGLNALLARGPDAGVAAVCFDTSIAALPAACAGVAQVHAPTGARLTLRGPGTAATSPVVIDQVSSEWAVTLARGLAPLRDPTDDAATLPGHCELLDVLRIPTLDESAIEARWQESGGGARACIGIAADGPIELDLERDGPHALVAGTTGSGKSELLQTLVAGLAANHPPDELNVLLIDYKGGSAFADCARLPHAIGLVTDLDQYGTERALRALTSELRRRERLFAAAGARDLRHYRSSAGGEPVPRIVIVVDEFAALADELPDFVRGLVAVAQRGRSLGVHLVLATQRPGSAVSAEIRANTSVRIALRVTDAAESNDVIDTADAAGISRAAAGRGYVRLGSSLTCFQSAHATAVYDAHRPEVAVLPLGPWRRAEPAAVTVADTQLARLVDAQRRAAELGRRGPARPVWLPPLPNQLSLRDLEPTAAESTIVLGMIDLPDEQRVAPLTLDLAAGPSLLLAGAPRSGRTHALAAVALASAAQLASSALHLHVVDATGVLARAVASLPHCATLLGPDDVALAPRLLYRLEAEAARRVAHASRPASADPALLLLIDGWETLCSSLPDLDAAHCAERLAAVLRAGPAAGVTVVVSGDRTALAPRFAGGFAERLLLRMADRTDYAFAGVRPGDVPVELPPGRGVRAGDGAVLQLGYPGADATPDELRRCATDIALRDAPAVRSPDTIVIRPLPARVQLTDLTAKAGQLVVGIAGDAAQPLALDPFAGTRRILIIGPPRSGRSTTLQLLAAQASAAGMAALVAAPERSPLAAHARQLRLPLIGPPAGDRLVIPASTPALVLVDDCETFTDTPLGDQLTTLARDGSAGVSMVVAACADDLATAYRGLAAELRRSRCGILLRPGPVDGELLGIRLPRRPSSGPPGRGVVVGDPAWGPLFGTGEPVPIQVATP